MTTTCTHPCTVVNHAPTTTLRWPAFNLWNSLARLGAWASHAVHTRYTDWRQTEALHNLDLHQLQDIGAPDWLQQRAAARQAQESYEYIKAMSRSKY